MALNHSAQSTEVAATLFPFKNHKIRTHISLDERTSEIIAHLGTTGNLIYLRIYIDISDLVNSVGTDKNNSTHYNFRTR